MDSEVKVIDLDDRCATPDRDDIKVHSIEVHFSIASYITRDQQRQLYALLEEIANSPKNTPKDGVHWLSESGAKMNYSALDAAILGVPVGEDPPADGEEPIFDEDVLYFATAARSFSSEQERSQELERRRRSS